MSAHIVENSPGENTDGAPKRFHGHWNALDGYTDPSIYVQSSHVSSKLYPDSINLPRGLYEIPIL